MTDAKTVPTGRSVPEFLEAVDNDDRRVDSHALCRLMTEVTGEEPVLWGSSIVGFGSRHYKYASGREGDWPRVGFSPRKQALTLYLNHLDDGFSDYQNLLSQLGKHKTGAGCLYLKRLADADSDVLRQIILRSYAPDDGGVATS